MLTLTELHRLVEEFGQVERFEVRSFELRGVCFGKSARPDLMGVVNLSADSWYRESVCLNEEAAVNRGLRLSAEGALLVDVGAESTILHAARVDEQGQKSLLLPVVKRLVQKGVLVSVETYHPGVTKSALDAGAAVVNMTRADSTEEIYRMAADYGAGVIICYIQGGATVRDVGDFQIGKDHLEELERYFGRELEKAEKVGVKAIWIDPGMGFYYRNLQDSAVRVNYQMHTFLETYRLRKLGWPVCHALPHAFEYFEDEVRVAEPFFAMLAALGGASLLRTHEVRKVMGVIRTMESYRAR